MRDFKVEWVSNNLLRLQAVGDYINDKSWLVKITSEGSFYAINSEEAEDKVSSHITESELPKRAEIFLDNYVRSRIIQRL